MEIACIVTNDFEDSELRKPYDALTAAGHKVVMIGFKAGEEVKGKRGVEKMKIDKGIDQVKPEDFGALLIPGGYSPDQLRADPRFVEFVRRFDDMKKPIAAVCHGPQLLLAAERVKGRTMTAWKTVQVDLRLAGAKVVDREVVVDGNLITSRQPSDLDVFSREFISRLKNGATTRP
jgi:protease I